MDTKYNSTILMSGVRPQAVTYLAQESKQFWIDITNTLVESVEGKTSKLQDLQVDLAF